MLNAHYETAEDCDKEICLWFSYENNMKIFIKQITNYFIYTLKESMKLN